MWQKWKIRRQKIGEIKRRSWVQAKLLCVDLELTSLDIKTSHITSIGWVESQGFHIQLNSCQHHIIHTTADLEQSPVIHGLTQRDIEQGEAVKPILEKLLAYPPDWIWVFHHAPLDMTVLQRVCNELGLDMRQRTYVDTLKLGRYLQQRRLSGIVGESVTLDACRSRYQLPKAPAHNALDDAMATIELLFAQLSSLGNVQKLTLNDIAHTGALRF